MKIDRLESRLPDVLTDLSLPAMPDYIDSLLSRTERMSQRPRWTLLERWIPVSTLEATLPGRRPASVRPLLVLAVVAALIAASLAWYAGTHHPLPPPFGLARNGVVVTNNAKGDIISIDPATGDTDTLVAGPNLCCATFSPNGQYIDYLRVLVDGAEPSAWVIATVDGTTVREFPPDVLRGFDHAEWSPASDKLLLTTSRSGTKIIDVATGAMTQIRTSFAISKASWLGTTGDLLLSSIVNPESQNQIVRFARLAAGDSTPTELTELPYAVHAPEVSPDGSKFLYFIWGPEPRLNGRVHVYDLATNTDVAVTSEDASEPEHNVEDPHWSPDGSMILATWMFAGYDQLGLSPATGGDPTFIGPKMTQDSVLNGVDGMRFSPDGKNVLVHYTSDDSTWLLPVNGDPGTKVPWNVADEWGWQRLAP